MSAVWRYYKVDEAAAEPVSKAPHHEACSSMDIAFEEILQERQSQGWSVSTTSAETQVQTYLFTFTVALKSKSEEFVIYYLIVQATSQKCSVC